MKAPKFPVFVTAVLLAGTLSLAAQNLVVSLVLPAEDLVPATTVKLDLLAVNPSLTAAPFEAPTMLYGTLVSGTKSWPVELASTRPGTVSVAPGTFAYRGYTLALPPGVSGQLVLEITSGEYQPLRGVLKVSADRAVAGSKPPATPLSTLDAATPALAQVQRSFIGHFGPHEPVYFTYGTTSPGAKFQFSFKYRLLDFQGNSGSTAQRALQFGYTQRSLWDITGDSSPFYDTSYMPTLFYESLASQTAGNRFGPVTWVGYQAGYQHESNGQGVTASRSLNTLFLRTAFIIGAPEDWHLIVAPKIWAYVGDLSNNPKLSQYRGNGEFLLVLGRNGGTALAYTGHAGRDFNHFTTQLDLTVPLRIKLLDFASYFLVQYFNGYGESLRDYDKKSAQLRAGLSLVR
ncbi:MAG: Outer membrane phospholipase A [Verrucomicrobia bacterium]|nr:MAG: Outer membrane phospholipase A [Verrucomicrobiota bacterium]